VFLWGLIEFSTTGMALALLAGIHWQCDGFMAGIKKGYQ
jgi:hypothetical protein